MVVRLDFVIRRAAEALGCVLTHRPWDAWPAEGVRVVVLRLRDVTTRRWKSIIQGVELIVYTKRWQLRGWEIIPSRIRSQKIIRRVKIILTPVDSVAVFLSLVVCKEPMGRYVLRYQWI